MKIYKHVVLFLISVFSVSVFGNGAIEGKVNKMAIDRTYTTNRVFVQVGGDKSNIPPCHTNTSWSFVLPLDSEIDKAVYSMLLSAHATGKSILLEGRGLCNVHSSIETLTYANH